MSKPWTYEPPKGAVHVHELAHPIEVGGTTLTHVELRRPRGRDLRATDGLKPMTQQLQLIELCGNLTRAAVEELDATDIAALGAVLSGFLESGPPTGASDS